jgi:hypothetical protein
MKAKLLLGAMILYLISLGISSCSSNNTAGGQVNPNANSYSVDPNVYFRITFNGQTKTTFGLNSNGNTSALLNTYCGAYVSSVGSTYSDILFSVKGGAINDLLRQAGTTQNLSQIDVIDIHFSRDGTPIGAYNNLDGGEFFNDISGSVETSYFLAYSLNNTYGNSITVTSIDQNYITGTLSFQLQDGSNLIPATGSFRLHKL